MTTKLSNRDQSAQRKDVKRALKASLKRLKLSYVDSYLIHSPLTDAVRRLASWQALLELREEGLCRSVGVANWGPQHLGELEAAFPSADAQPQVLQLELSPFNQHADCLAWAARHDARVVAASWSKLSGAYGWGGDANVKALAGVAKAHGGDKAPAAASRAEKKAAAKGVPAATKAQVLVRWSLQRGFCALPRSGPASTTERLAIRQNSARGVSGVGFDPPLSSLSPSFSEVYGSTYDGVSPTWSGGPLSVAEMKALDAMDEGLAAGRLGRTDGWTAADVTGEDWDPTASSL